MQEASYRKIWLGGSRCIERTESWLGRIAARILTAAPCSALAMTYQEM